MTNSDSTDSSAEFSHTQSGYVKLKQIYFSTRFLRTKQNQPKHKVPKQGMYGNQIYESNTREQ